MIPAASLTVSEPATKLPDLVRGELQSLIDGGKLTLPLLSDVATEVMRLAQDERAGAHVFAAAVRKDASMAAHVLRVANGAAVRGQVPIVSLQQAISRLGVRAVSDIAFAVACKERVFTARGFELEVRNVFRHCLMTGLYAQEIARARRTNVEEAFLSGLLHDVGRPVLLQAVVDVARKHHVTPPRDAVLAYATERHTSVGAALVRRWRLPEALAVAIERHHDPYSSDPKVLVVMPADELADLTARETPHIVALAAALNLYSEQVEELVKRGEALRATAEQLS